MRHIQNFFSVIDILTSGEVASGAGRSDINSRFKVEFLDRLCTDAERNRRALEQLEYKSHFVYGDANEPPIDHGLGLTRKEITLSHVVFELEEFLLDHPEILEKIRIEAIPEIESEELIACLRMTSLLINCLQVRELELPESILETQSGNSESC